MWYLAWVLGILFACSMGVMNALWQETNGKLDEE
ncbi:cytochrome bd-I oxidase subunit CydX [Azomonas macrocytogenes]|uniref:Cyd operon protein YbgT n=1 Tax=Azomonas macrocytogenes TaxID=69962 RepID=A0A839T1Z5_AZOMA|nr:cytochrome bd-I oxidase subunit CydX [Azomonas macrocytogenes]MBB3101763.1 cyd operon protein YbgT [Azomonas macrocytogenes]